MPSLSSEERQQLHDSLVEMLTDKYPFEQWKKLARAPGGESFGRAEWKQYADMGWLGIALPEESGGSAGGMTELGIVMAAAGRFLLLEPLIGTVVLGANAIERAGTSSQKAFLGRIATGDMILAFCHSEPGGGYDRDYVRAVASKDGTGWRIDGEKAFTLGAHAADLLVVSARIGSASGPVGLFLVQRTAEGVSLNQAPALDGRHGAAVRLTGVKVGTDARLGDSDADRLGVIDALIDRAAISACAEAVGAMAAVTDITVEYLKTRQQFGQPLSKFQVLQHRLVDMSVSTEEARAIVHAALQALDDEAKDAGRTVAMAKVKTAQSSRFVGGQGIQLHGGMGMTDELVVGHYYKRLTMCETLFGDAEWYLRRIGATAT
ncbi:MAG: acyl-CoA dehydrogenase family protein [Hyphomicrobiaceae bacterium]|nr:acyl-CoA dehydrogenase family protein [Hyphomicrobiaceae bacterium]